MSNSIAVSSRLCMKPNALPVAGSAQPSVPPRPTWPNPFSKPGIGDSWKPRWNGIGTTMFRSGRLFGLPISPSAISAERNCSPSIVPPLASAAYIFANPRPVTTPLAAGTSPSRNGISPCTKDLMPGK